MAEEKKDDKPKKKMDPLFIGVLVFALVNISILGGAAFLIYQNTLGWKPPVVLESELRKLLEEHEQAAREGRAVDAARVPASLVVPSFNELLIQLEPFITNLDGEPRRIVKVVLSFKVLDEYSYEEVLDPNRLPRVRDSILTILQKTNYSEIESLQGKLFLKDRILREVNPLLDEGVVREVYFSEFVAQ